MVRTDDLVSAYLIEKGRSSLCLCATKPGESHGKQEAEPVGLLLATSGLRSEEAPTARELSLSYKKVSELIPCIYHFAFLCSPRPVSQFRSKKSPIRLLLVVLLAIEGKGIEKDGVDYGEDELVGAVLGRGSQARHHRRRVGWCCGRVGGVQPAKDAAEGDGHAPDPRQDARPGAHARRPRRSSPRAPLLRQQQEQHQEQGRRPGLRLLLAAAAGDRRRRKRDRAGELVNLTSSLIRLDARTDGAASESEKRIRSID